MLADVIALLVVVKEAAELIGLTAETLTAINAALDLLFGLGTPQYNDLTLDEKTEILKRCTKIVANLDLDLNCFPLGYTTTLLFDLDGNPYP